MNHNFVRVAFLLDKSHSMQAIQTTTISGFNEYLSKVKGDNHGFCKLKLGQFNQQFEITCDLPIAQVPELTTSNYIPNGTTAYLDALGTTINDLGHELSLMPESDRPGTVTIFTLTDGLENASKRYTHGQIADMIQHQQGRYNWDFVYLGANHDAVKFASSLNIPASKIMSYTANVSDPEAMINTFNAAASYTNRVRSRGISGQSVNSVTFTEAERGASVSSAYQSPTGEQATQSTQAAQTAAGKSEPVTKH